MDGYHKLILWLAKGDNSVALIGQELLICTSCPIRARVLGDRPSLHYREAIHCRFSRVGELYPKEFSKARNTVNKSYLSPHCGGGRLLQTCLLIGQESQLSSSCPIRTSDQTNNNTLIGWNSTICNDRPPLPHWWWDIYSWLHTLSWSSDILCQKKRGVSSTGHREITNKFGIFCWKNRGLSD